jgi:hypothetical protein
MQTAEARLRRVADYMQMPDDGTRYDLIEGEVLMGPAPNCYRQQILANLLLILLNGPLRTVSGSDQFESSLFPGLTIAAAEVMAD